jgi:hypothetical protein
MFGTPTDEEAVAKVINDAAPIIFDYLEAQLGNNDYLQHIQLYTALKQKEETKLTSVCNS